MMSTDAEVYVERVRQGDIEALAAFIAVRRGTLLAYIERRLGAGLRRKIEPEDVFQEVSAEAVRSLPAIALGDRDPFSWLCQLAERRIIDAHRRFFCAARRAAGARCRSIISRPTKACAHDRPLGSQHDHGQPGILPQHPPGTLGGVLASLPDDQREALRLRDVEGMPSKQIAERLGKTDGAVRVMLTRSLNRLQSILGAEPSQ